MMHRDQNGKLDMTMGYHVTDADRTSRGIYNKTVGDRVVPERLDEGIVLDFGTVSNYLDFFPITTPTNPGVNTIRVYHKTTGSSTKLYVLNDAGVEGEILTTASVTLDGAYSNGSTIDVDTTDVIWRLTGARLFTITNASGATEFFRVSSSGVKISGAYTLPTADGAANTILTTNGAGTISFSSISTLGDATYLRLDATNDPITGGVQITHAASTGTVVPSLGVTDGAHTALTGSTERSTARFNAGVTQQWATGALALQRSFRYDPPTLAAVGASTFTDAVTMAITGAPVKGTNVTLTNTHAIYVAAGAVSTATNSYGLTVNAQTGATNNYSAQFLGGLTIHAKGIKKTKSTATIATGVITYSSGYMEIDTEAAAGTDDLDTINPGIAEEGTELILKSTNNARVPTIKHGTGNIRLAGGTDFAEDDVRDRITLQYDGTDWVELARSSNT